MPEYPANADSLMEILRRLRAPDGCPWDREQTRASLVRHLEGECAELIYAIDREDVPNICEELGDVLMNLLFQVVIAEEKGDFVLADVWRNIIDKMVGGKINKFFEQNCLMQQAFVKDDSMSVGKYLEGNGVKLVKYERFEKGEGLEKKVDDFANEVAGMVK